MHVSPYAYAYELGQPRVPVGCWTAKPGQNSGGSSWHLDTIFILAVSGAYPKKLRKKKKVRAVRDFTVKKCHYSHTKQKSRVISRKYFTPHAGDPRIIYLLKPPKTWMGVQDFCVTPLRLGNPSDTENGNPSDTKNGNPSDTGNGNPSDTGDSGYEGHEFEY